MSNKPEDRLPKDYKGFLFRKLTGALIINSNNFDKVIEVMKMDNIKHLEVNPNFFKETDLSFLDKFSFLEELTILIKAKDISPIHKLLNLKKLNIQLNVGGKIDFALFQHLESCFFHWGVNGSETIYQAENLNELRIDSYNKYELNELASLNKLVSLSLYGANIVSLQGIKGLTNLKKIDLTGSSNLEDITQLEELTQLSELRLDNCKKINSFEPIKKLRELKSICFNNIGNIPSIDFLSPLTKLSEVIFTENTNVIDGNLNVLGQLYKNDVLKTALFRIRKHYTHTPQDLGYKMPDFIKRY